MKAKEISKLHLKFLTAIASCQTTMTGRNGESYRHAIEAAMKAVTDVALKEIDKAEE